MKVQRFVGRCVPAFTLAVALAAVAAAPARAEVHEVQVASNRFIPNDITIRPGDTIMFFWVGDFHTVTSRDGLFNSGLQNRGFTFLVDFPIAGTFRYVCSPHQALGMVGVVNVKPPRFPKTTVTPAKPALTR